MRTSPFEMALFLYSRGYYIGPRDKYRNTDHEGLWMVCGDPVSEVATTDASTGGFCIVGDDLDALIREAYEFESN